MHPQVAAAPPTAPFRVSPLRSPHAYITHNSYKTPKSPKPQSRGGQARQPCRAPCLPSPTASSPLSARARMRRPPRCATVSGLGHDRAACRGEPLDQLPPSPSSPGWGHATGEARSLACRPQPGRVPGCRRPCRSPWAAPRSTPSPHHIPSRLPLPQERNVYVFKKGSSAGRKEMKELVSSRRRSSFRRRLPDPPYLRPHAPESWPGIAAPYHHAAHAQPGTLTRGRHARGAPLPPAAHAQRPDMRRAPNCLPCHPRSWVARAPTCARWRPWGSTCPPASPSPPKSARWVLALRPRPRASRRARAHVPCQAAVSHPGPRPCSLTVTPRSAPAALPRRGAAPTPCQAMP